jgi:hypothetical protein
MPRYFLMCVCMVLSLTRISAELVVSEPRDIAAAKYEVASGDDTRPRIASDGHEFLAVWQSDNNVRAARVRGTGEVRLPTIAVGSGTWPDVAFGGGRYLIVWQGSIDLRAAFADDDGLSPAFTLGALSAAPPMVAYDGSRFLVMWRADRRTYAGAFISPSGDVSPLVRIPVMNVARQQKLVATRGKFYLAVAAGGRVSLVPITESGAGDPILVARVEAIPELHAGTSADAIVLAWQRGRTIEYVHVNGLDTGTVQSFDADGMSLQTILSGERDAQLVYGNATTTLARRALPGTEPSALPLPSFANGIGDGAHNGTTFAYVFENREFHHDVFVLVPESVFGAVPMHQRLVAQHTAAIAAGDSLALVAWEEWRKDGRVLVANRVDSAGYALGRNGIELARGIDGFFTPRVGWDGESWLVLFDEPAKSHIRGVRVSTSGRITGEITIPSRARNALGMAWSGSHWIIVFAEPLIPDLGEPRRLFVVRMTREGEILEKAAITERDLPRSIAVATSPIGTLVAWSANLGVEGTLLRPNGTSMPFRLSNVYGRSPAVAWNGQSFVVAFVHAQLDRVEWALVKDTTVVHPPASAFIPVSSGSATEVALTPFRDGTLLAWNDIAAPAYVALIDTNGNIAEPPVRFGDRDTYVNVSASGSYLLHRAEAEGETGSPRSVVRKVMKR